jgi:hypothetical protein
VILNWNAWSETAVKKVSDEELNNMLLECVVKREAHLESEEAAKTDASLVGSLKRFAIATGAIGALYAVTGQSSSAGIEGVVSTGAASVAVYYAIGGLNVLYKKMTADRAIEYLKSAVRTSKENRLVIPTDSMERYAKALDGSGLILRDVENESSGTKGVKKPGRRPG